MPRPRRNIVSIHAAYAEGLIPFLIRPLSSIPGLRGGEALSPFQVWDYLGTPLSDLCGAEYGMDRGDVAHNDVLLQGLNAKLVRNIVLTLELKEHLGISPDRAFDPRERPVTWRSLVLPLPALAQGTRGVRHPSRMSAQEMREVLDRYRATLHMQIDDAFQPLYRLIARAPHLAEHIARKLLRLGY